MNLNRVHALILTAFLAAPLQVFALTTYTYSDTNAVPYSNLYSGSFSVSTQLADGTYSFASAANQPPGFSENFFTTSFLDGRGVSRTPVISLFDITIKNGLVSLWDIRATTLFTFVTYSTGGRGYSKVYHDNSVLIYHDTNVAYLPGAGMAYQASIPNGDYQTYYTSGFAYQEAPTGARYGMGVWSIATTPVPEPETYAMLLAGLGLLGTVARRRKPKSVV